MRFFGFNRRGGICQAAGRITGEHFNLRSKIIQLLELWDQQTTNRQEIHYTFTYIISSIFCFAVASINPDMATFKLCMSTLVGIFHVQYFNISQNVFLYTWKKLSKIGKNENPKVDI